MKHNDEYYNVRTYPKYNRNIIETVATSMPLIYIHDLPHTWLGACTSIKSGGLK